MDDNIIQQDDCPERHALTIKQQKFTLGVFETGNASQSYRDAGYIVNTDASAYAAASRLLTNVKVQAFLGWLRQKAVDASIMNVLERKQKLSLIGRASVADFLTRKEGGLVTIELTPETANHYAIDEVVTSELVVGDSPIKTVITKVKLKDSMRAIDLLNKMDGEYQDGPAVNIDNRKVVNTFVNIDEEKVAKAIIEAERLGLTPEIFGGVVNSEDAAVLSSPADI